jgi:hypothetical protein
MKNSNFNFIFFLLFTLLFSCSSHNRIHYRNEKKIQEPQNSGQPKNSVNEILTENDKDTLIEIIDQVNSENYISTDQKSNSKERFPRIKSNSIILIEKINEEHKISSDKRNDEITKSKHLKRFNTNHWILLSSLILLILSFFAALASLNGFQEAFVPLLIVAAAFYLIGFIIVIVQSWIIPKKIPAEEKTRVFKRRLKSARVLFVFSLVGLSLTALVLIAISS